MLCFSYDIVTKMYLTDRLKFDLSGIQCSRPGQLFAQVTLENRIIEGLLRFTRLLSYMETRRAIHILVSISNVYITTYVCIYLCICVYVSMQVCTYVCMCMHMSIYVRMYQSMRVRMYVRMYEYIGALLIHNII